MIPVCPKCDVELFLLKFQELAVDYCQQCRGLWLDAGELQALLERTGAGADDPLLGLLDQYGRVPNGPKHLCTRCDQPLHEIRIGPPGGTGLTLDRCPRGHGLWFDADELEQLLAMFSPASGASRTVDYLHEVFGTNLKTQRRN